jgi:hypothetical protein
MRVALHTTFAASKNPPLAEVVDRVRQAFLDTSLGEPVIRFTLLATALPSRAAIVDRVLKRHPEMERFLSDASPLPGHSQPGSTKMRQFSNAATGEAIAYAAIQAIAVGVPRSYPFNSVAMHFYAPVFGEALPGLPKFGHSLPGVLVTDNWWVNGRQRSLSVYTVVEVEEGAKKLPPNPDSVDAVIKACGKVKQTVQVPILGPTGRVEPAIPQANAEAIKAIVADYRARIKTVIERAALPHNLPAAAEIRQQSLGVLAGPRKPALEAAFKPLGYSCRGGSGEFHLTRRTSGNLTVELYLDVGTWSHEISASFRVEGAGFRASLSVPVAPQNASGGQYPIGDAAQWQKIVENLAAMVRELDRSFLPEIEQAAGPSPAWYQPTS